MYIKNDSLQKASDKYWLNYEVNKIGGNFEYILEQTNKGFSDI